jgi:uncharacterized membrane protein
MSISDLDEKDSLPGTKRVEALADGIFAIAMTLLVLNLSFPLVDHGVQSLLNMLSSQVTDFLDYGLSFILLAIFWIMHHQQFHYIQRTDSRHIWINIFILLFIALVPFSTSLIGDYGSNVVANIFFSANILVIGFLFLINWIYATGSRRLVKHDLNAKLIIRTTRRISVIPCVALMSMILSLFSPFWSNWLFLLIPLVQLFESLLDK